MKKILGIYGTPNAHWVGDGFPVRSLFSYDGQGKLLSPFLLLDYAGPTYFSPTEQPRGVGPHPHRGFETVTIVYKGGVAHRDSIGQGGIIGPGDVQWMTAGSGILHEEFHSAEFSQAGGELEMVQLWVNLPARHKMTAPGYQALSKHEIPIVNLPKEAGTARIIAGKFDDAKGPARTFTSMNVWDLSLRQNSDITLTLPDGWSVALIVLRGSVCINASDRTINESELVILDRAGQNLTIEATKDASILLLSGEPIDEPIIGYGPFVMNSKTEILQAIADFNGNKFGHM